MCFLSSVLFGHLKNLLKVWVATFEKQIDSSGESSGAAARCRKCRRAGRLLVANSCTSCHYDIGPILRKNPFSLLLCNRPWPSNDVPTKVVHHVSSLSHFSYMDRNLVRSVF